MTHCQACSADVHPSVGIEGGVVVEHCPNCGSCISKRDRGGNAVNQASVHPDVAVSMVAERPRVAQRSASQTVAVAAPTTRPVLAPNIAQPLDILGMARARLAALDVELARLEGLKKERKQLAAMLRAADAKTESKQFGEKWGDYGSPPGIGDAE